MTKLKDWFNNLAPEQRAETMEMNSITESQVNESHLEAAWPVLIRQRLPEKADDILLGMVTQYCFDDVRNWKLDVAWPERKMAVELHGLFDKGGPHGSVGRHLRPLGFTEDREKMNAAQLQGWIVLEFTTISLQTDVPFVQLVAAFEERNEKSIR